MRGQGLDQAAQRPFQLLTGVAKGLVEAARLESPIEEQIRAGLGDHLEAACSALTELTALFGSGVRGQLGPESFAETRSVQALAALLDALEANVPGTIRDIDTEFLHDLRIAVRRTRSVSSAAGCRFSWPSG